MLFRSSSILQNYIEADDILLDVGTGELTTISQVLQKLQVSPSQVYIFDISWSRLFKGLKHAKANLANKYETLIPFVANMTAIPLPDKCVNITTSSHALEPNGGKLQQVISEIFRVTSDMVILFEPSYEINSDDGKRRMEDLGYIRDLDAVISSVGGKVLEKVKVINVANALNPTMCYVIQPPKVDSRLEYMVNSVNFSIPGTSVPLTRFSESYYSKQTGLTFPILREIPILREDCAFLATALEE